MSHVKRGRTSDGKEWVFYVDLGCDAEEVWQSIQREEEVKPVLKNWPPDFQVELRPGDPPWVEPLVGLALEWWFKNKKLTIYRDSMYVMAWGPNIHSQMKDGTLGVTSSFRTLWTWLHTPEKTL